MKEKIGNAIREIRQSKGLTGKELCRNCENVLTPQQLSNIEKGTQCTSFEKLVFLLGALNIRYDEFLYLVNDDYLNKKDQLEKKFLKHVIEKNLEGIEFLINITSDLYEKREDVFFQHLSLRAQAMKEYLQNGNDYSAVKKYIYPIEGYLTSMQSFNFYEIYLTRECLFMMDIDNAILFVNKSLEVMETLSPFYENKNDRPVILSKIATLCLEDKKYLKLSFYYSQMNIDFMLKHKQQDATQLLHAKIINQIACRKLKNGMFDKKYFLSLVNTFKLLGLNEEYNRLLKLIDSQGIKIKIQ